MFQIYINDAKTWQRVALACEHPSNIADARANMFRAIQSARFERFLR